VNYTLQFHIEAEIEMNEAAAYLERGFPGLGGFFLAAVEKAVNHIRLFPEAAVLIRGRARRRPVPRFPYSIVYSIRNTQIRILAVSHQKRRPYYWISRL